MRKPTRAIEDLRTAIDCLPPETQQAMLDGVRSNPIIVGAYTDRSGGVCPMLAAHRCGGRTDLLAFARAWDRFTGARGRARRATDRELHVLTAHLEASVLGETSVEFGQAIAEHSELVDRHGRRPRRRTSAGDADRTRELRGREGWAWLRPFRRYDEYARALERVEAEAAGAADSPRAVEDAREPALH